MTISRIVGTAGHIDHGKTELVRALTGIDTDRLKEEKERKISIDLGFAPLDLPGGTRAAVIDVPGHERFVKNMLAGVGGIDAVVFTIAADEGVMPQTAEHLEILHFLGIRSGMIVLTKADLVDEEMIELVRDEVEETLRGTTLEGAPILVASSVTGEGIPEVALALEEILARAPERPDPGWFRQPVDRVFSSRGFGTVVTGTVWSGEARVGDRLELLPSEREVRIRKVEVFSEEVECARPGQRSALALHGVSREEAIRGDTLVTPGVLVSTHMVDARFSLAPSAKEMTHRQRIRFHHGAAELLGRVILLEGETLPSGEDGYVQFRLESPIAVARGDRFIVRSYSPARTIGGGIILDASPPKRKPAGRSDLHYLRVAETGDGEEMIRTLLASSDTAVVPLVEMSRRLQIRPDEMDRVLADLRGREEVRVVPGGAALEEVLTGLKGEVEKRVEEVSSADRLKAGLPREEIRRGLSRTVEVSLFQRLLDEIASEGKITVRGEMIIYGKGGLPPKMARTAALVEKSLEEARFAPPSLVQIASAVGVDGKGLASVIETLVRLGRLVKVAPPLIYRAAEVDEIEGILRKCLSEKGELTVSGFKEIAGISRKYAVPLLEYFDGRKITRREGDRRVPGSAFREDE